MKWNNTELAYLAGIIDGEGCFYIGKPGGHYTLRLFVMSTSKCLIDYLYKTYGGFQYSRKKENSSWKIRHEWFVDTLILEDLLPLLREYLIIKKEHLEVAIEFRKTYPKFGKRPRVSNEIISIRDNCHLRMKFLNKKGP
jgi:hypothetical protein